MNRDYYRDARLIEEALSQADREGHQTCLDVTVRFHPDMSARPQ